MRNHCKLKTYRFSEKLVKKLNQLTKYNIIESKFVRNAIEEKIQRDFPNLKIKKEKEYCPL